MSTQMVVKAGVGIIAFAVVVAILLFLLPPSTSEQYKNDLDRLGAATFTDYEGATVSLREYQGMPLVINAWAVWCPFCREELPDFAALQADFQDEIVVIAIDRQESLAQAKGYTDELGITEQMVFLLDPKDAFYQSIGGFSMPETVFIDERGQLVFHKRGPMTLEEMREHVRTYFQLP